MGRGHNRASRSLAEHDPARAKRPRASADVAARLRTHSSSAIAKIIEYQLLGDLGAELLLRGAVLEVLRSDVDAFGHDVVLEVGGKVRHVQLKTKVEGGKTREVSCHTALGRKPSGCIVWITYDPETYRAVEYACFGGLPGQVLSDIGDVFTKRSTPTGDGSRPLRTQHRDVAYSKFKKMKEVGELADWLFGPAPSDPGASAPTVVMGPAGSPMLVRTAGVTVMPMSVNITDETALVSIIDHTGTSRECEHFSSEQSSGTIIFVELTTGRWGCPPALDNAAVRDAMQEAIRLLRQSLGEGPSASA